MYFRVVTGDHCELCAKGYYGDPRNGGRCEGLIINFFNLWCLSMSGLSGLNQRVVFLDSLVMGDCWACLPLPSCFVRSGQFAIYMKLLSSHFSSHTVNPRISAPPIGRN